MTLPGVGNKVRLKTDYDGALHSFGSLPSGLTGTVTEITQHYESGINIKLDQHFDALDEWDNTLQVGAGSFSDFDMVALFDHYFEVI